jgi:hypothetical protein
LPIPLVAILLLIIAAAPRAASFNDDERRFLQGQHALLEISPDPCRLASRLEAEYKRLLDAATPAQDVADIRTAVEGKPGIPLHVGDGLRITDAFALYDHESKSIYLSSASLSAALPETGGGCPSDERVAGLARGTVAVYVHELAHAMERRSLGDDIVDTREAEVLAYARESRFLAGLNGWPNDSLKKELERRRELNALIQENEEIVGRVEALRQTPPEEGLDQLKKYVDQLEELRPKIEKLQAEKADVDPFQVSLAAMVESWREGWPNFLRFILVKMEDRPSLTERKENLETSRRFLDTSESALKEEKPGTFPHQVAEHSVRLGKEDVLFWGDEKKVGRALEFYKARFKDVRPPPKPEDSGQRH